MNARIMVMTMPTIGYDDRLGSTIIASIGDFN